MTTYTVEPTGRTWAGTSYNRTTGRWRDGGPEYVVTLHDDDQGRTPAELDDEELLAAAWHVALAEDPLPEQEEALDAEIRVRLDLMGDAIKAWNGEHVCDLASMLNELEAFALDASNALYPGGRDEFRAEDSVDVTSLGWFADAEPPAIRDDVYACDKAGRWLVLVSGTTDDGWSFEEPPAAAPA